MSKMIIVCPNGPCYFAEAFLAILRFALAGKLHQIWNSCPSQWQVP